MWMVVIASAYLVEVEFLVVHEFLTALVWLIRFSMKDLGVNCVQQFVWAMRKLRRQDFH